MKNTVVVAGAAAAFLVLAPGAALAATPTGAPPVTSTSTIQTAPPSPTGMPTVTPTPDPGTDFPDGPIARITRSLTVSPGKAVPGARVKLDFACRTHGPDEKVSVQSAALTFGKPGDPARWATATVKDVKPGKYAVTMYCAHEDSTAWLEVLPAAKQVAKVPSGAPQTGGTDGPAVDNSGAAAAMGVLALGGAGLALARRARRR
ncbi:hypothetical protein [Amycolatopsis rifamycinica]|uniref:Gram-positive cocci surface proteins LPxTG domain-containing protein n=1 Tax=Amycolatopsis rifamycinica TaxID=287986 RepID=A0A066U296_9PSEU|nr:hypothetical protein [Amycolatopsis rifamycinica]KDN18353.1 hypothetical protein DV20_31425 [Amycolatopsis rifamycinica]